MLYFDRFALFSDRKCGIKFNDLPNLNHWYLTQNYIVQNYCWQKQCIVKRRCWIFLK